MKLNMTFYYFYRMSFEDFMDNFKSINICHLSPGNMSIDVVSWQLFTAFNSPENYMAAIPLAEWTSDTYTGITTASKSEGQIC